MTLVVKNFSPAICAECLYVFRLVDVKFKTEFVEIALGI
jgi:hypothetical protein